MRPYSIIPDTKYYFCTDTIVGWRYVFTSPEFFEAIIESFKYCRQEKGLRIHGYVIMPNHVHSIVSSGESNLSEILRDYKRYTSRRISSLLHDAGNRKLAQYFSIAADFARKGNEYKVWQSGSHAEAIVSDKFFCQKLEYIHQNPVRKGFVARPEDWLYSSARNYILGDNSIIAIDGIAGMK